MLFRQTLDGINNQYSWLQRASGAVGSMCDYRSEGSWFPGGLALLRVAQGECAFVLSITMRLKTGIFTLLLW